MQEFQTRTSIIIGEKGIGTLARSKVAVFGLGGVGAAAALDLIRCGVGNLIVTDFDTVAESNLNRLSIGFKDTIGKNKTQVLRQLGQAINPDVIITENSVFMHGNDTETHIPEADFYLDAIDSLNPKVNLIISLLSLKKPFISSMGAGGRLDPTRLKIEDIWKTASCPLAYLVRKRLRKRGIKDHFSVIYSDEPPVPPIENHEPNHDGKGRTRKMQGSTPFVPQTAGHFAAWFAVTHILKEAAYDSLSHMA